MPNPTYATLEEAQAEIIRLNEELTAVQNERDSYSTKLSKTEKDLENVRELNQKYFLKLSQQYIPATEPDDKDVEDVPTCEEFAQTLTI